MQEENQRKIARLAEEKGLFMGKGAMELLAQRPSECGDLLEKFSKANPQDLVVSEEKLEQLIIQKGTKISQETVEETKTIRTTKPGAREYESRFRIMKDLDITGNSFSEGKVGDFLNFFRDKYEFLEQHLRKRPGFDPKKLRGMERISKGKEVHTIAMIREKQKTKNGHLIFKIEDMESECSLLAIKDDKAMEQAKNILLDEVLGIKAVKGNNDLLIAKNFIWPELKEKPAKTIKENISLAITSDFHIGSKLFLKKEAEKFAEWIGGNYGSAKDRERAGKIKYLFVAGDNVDGIGVYPEQIGELEIKDIFEQYNVFTRIMERIPEHIEVFICPGQHDAVRRADPQPAIDKEFVKELSQMKNMHFVGSPSWVEVEGFKTLMYHGASIHELYSHIDFLDTTKPEIAIKEALKRRDLMTGFGERQPYVPEQKNYLLIREEPDIYIGGDMHHNGYTVYKGTTIINSGTWQKRTNFQAAMGHIPTPGIVPVLELNTGKISENCFYQEKEEGKEA